jgi:hypothetical protein
MIPSRARLAILFAGAYALVACLSQTDRTYFDDSRPTGEDASTGNDAGAGADTGNDVDVEAKYGIGGSVTGLLGSGLVLQNAGGDDLPIPGSGVFEFPTKVAPGTPYLVTVKTQPSAPAQICSIVGATGTVQYAHITNVSVVCSTSAFRVGGTVSGLAASGESVVLRNNGLDDHTVNGNGGFQFPTPIASGQTYTVTVASKPARVTCTPSAATGSIGSTDVTDVVVTCVENTYTIGGTAVGVVGAGLQLTNATSGEVLNVPASSAFSFVQKVTHAGSIAVTVTGSPSGEVCAIANGAQSNVTADITNLAVTCQYREYFDTGSTFPIDGWTTSFTPAGGGRQPWVILADSMTTPSDTLANHAWAVGDNLPTSQFLTSPSLMIVSASAQVSFRHAYETESGYDGGALEIAINGGAFQDILAAGGSFVQGGYTPGALSTSYNNPIGGRPAWTGNSLGYVTTVANLPAAAAGQPVVLRWRFATDQQIAVGGWRVDTIGITP